MPDHFSILSLAALQPASPDWLWPRYLPRGHLTLLLGAPASGLSSLALDIAARLSSQAPMPPLPLPPNPPAPDPHIPPPAQILFVSHVHHAQSTLLPRLQLLNPHVRLDAFHLLPDLTTLAAREHVDALTRAIEDLPNLALLVFDPITSYMGTVGRLLAPPPCASDSALAILLALARIADRFNIAILLTAPLPPRLSLAGPPSRLLERALRLFPFSSLAGAVHLVLNPDQGPAPPAAPRLLVPVKSLASLPPPLRFTLGPALLWDASSVSLDQAFIPSDPVLRNTMQFLEQLLAHGPISACSVEMAATTNAIARSTLLRAKAALGIRSSRKDTTSPWYWHLPGDNRPFDLFAPPPLSGAPTRELLSTLGKR